MTRNARTPDGNLASDKRKQSLYFPEEMLTEIVGEANRQDRSLSWVVQQAWRVGRTEIMKFPGVNDYATTSPSSNKGSDGNNSDTAPTSSSSGTPPSTV